MSNEITIEFRASVTKLNEKLISSKQIIDWLENDI